MKKPVFAYNLVHSPYDGGYYAEVCNRMGEDIWCSDVYAMRIDAIAAVFNHFAGQNCKLIDITPPEVPDDEYPYED